jgi:hypothetical protein
VAFSSPSFGAAPVPVALAAFSGGPPTSADGPESGIENRVDSQKERAANFRRVYIFVLCSDIFMFRGAGVGVRLLVWCHSGQSLFSSGKCTYMVKKAPFTSSAERKSGYHQVIQKLVNEEQSRVVTLLYS